VAIFPGVDDGITVQEAAERLQTTVQTVRALARDKSLSARKVRGTWRVDPASVDEFLAAEGPLEGGRRRRSLVARQEAEIARLRAQVAELAKSADADEVVGVLAERDELRARVVVLEDALARMREVAELQRRAEEERSQVLEHLTAALGSAERSEQLRRKSVEILEDGLAGSVMPGHPPTARG
jgi:excisionase family DNA binding protein